MIAAHRPNDRGKQQYVRRKVACCILDAYVDGTSSRPRERRGAVDSALIAARAIHHFRDLVARVAGEQVAPGIHV